jgi:hypothetical protein
MSSLSFKEINWSLVEKRYYPTENKQLHVFIQNMLFEMRAKASLKVYGITILFPGVSKEESWRNVKGKVEILKTYLKQLYTAFAIIGIEAHEGRKKTKGSEEKVQKKLAGACHIHIGLGLYNDFLAPQAHDIYSDLFGMGFRDILVEEKAFEKYNKPCFDAKNFFVYCTKQAASQELKRLLRLNEIEVSVTIMSGLKSFEEKLRMVAVMLFILKKEVAFETIEQQLKEIENTGDEGVQVAEFMKHMMLQDGSYLRGEEIYKLQSGSKYTYKSTGKNKRDLVSYLWERAPVKLKEKIRKASSWIFGNAIRLLPEVKIDAQMVELSDGVYSFRLGEWSIDPKEDMYCKSCATFWEAESFHNLTWPETALELLRTNCSSELYHFLRSYGSLFHNRQKLAKVMYLHGDAGTGKTLLTEEMLRSVIGSESLGWVKSEGLFQLEGIVDAWVTVLQDYRWGNINTTDMLNLLDGTVVVADRKNKSAVPIENKNIVITSNDSPPNRQEIKRRLDQHEFKKNQDYQSEFYKQIVRESLGFAVLANIVYLSTTTREIDIPPHWKEKIRSILD